MESQFFAVAMITLLAVISPGPDFAMTVRNSLQNGRVGGLMTALGIACGVSVHILYTLMGFTFVLMENLWLLEIMKYLGASYLVWIGLKSLFAKKKDNQLVQSEQNIGSFGNGYAFRQGFICNALNPKTALFFIALFTQVVLPETSLQSQVGFGLFIACAHWIWFSCVAIALTHQKLDTVITKIKDGLEKVTGACLLGLGLKLLFYKG